VEAVLQGHRIVVVVVPVRLLARHASTDMRLHKLIILHRPAWGRPASDLARPDSRASESDPGSPSRTLSRITICRHSIEDPGPAGHHKDEDST
jgi:hypothetical protein